MTRRTDEERIVRYFQEAPLAKVEAVFSVVRGIVRGRTPQPAKVAKLAKQATDVPGLVPIPQGQTRGL